VPETIEDIGNGVVYGSDRLLTTVQYKRNDHCPILNNEEANEWLTQ